ncbi:cytochrome P450 81Q32-like [Mercurialis annua]|uniref:cytochrome P450 81Q32-like n=1 Tax=Mercurialis annua TaxID=3986 RepID=UPI00215E810F|nr:cytochrome P450 81Q32-like [Mercurialis annua]
MEISLSYCFLIFFPLYFISKYLLKVNKNLPPSPGLALPIIGHLYLFKKPLHRTFAAISKKHGPILFLKFGSRPVVLVSSPEAAEECFTKNDVVFANRPKLLAGKHLGYDYTTLVWASYGDHWRNLRRIAAVELLSSNRIQMFYNIRLDEIRSLARSLFRESKDAGKFITVDVKSTVFEFTLNVLMRMIAGKRYYVQDTAELGDGKKFKEIVAETFLVSGSSNIGDFVPMLKWVGLTKIENRLQALQASRDTFMQDLIEEHKSVSSDDDSGSGKKCKTMIDVLLELQKQEPEYYTDEIIRGMMLVLLTAGSDTSSGTLEWALTLLVNNPEALIKAREEMDKNIGQSKLLEDSDIDNLPYLQGIINETLRMKPAAPLIPAHESSQECTLGGYKIPRGTMLLVNMFAVHNDPNLWEEPTKFKPERYLKEDGLGYKLLPFGAGRRRCPGEGFALKNIGLALGTLVQCFEWERIGEELVDLTEGSGLSMPKAQPLIAKYRPRPTMVNLLSTI